ncbi:RRXRR domain-containing protein [Vibrio thalassae]|uniref:RRXRR domain-containing protein n=1 Tax=Vibrio thalassae TaxID=1243014 RepID=UPI0035219BBB
MRHHRATTEFTNRSGNRRQRNTNQHKYRSACFDNIHHNDSLLLPRLLNLFSTSIRSVSTLTTCSSMTCISGETASGAKSIGL